MERRLEIEAYEPDRFEVTVAEGSVVIRHRLDLSPDFLHRQGLADLDGETVLREAFAILLERELLITVPPATSLDGFGDSYAYLLPELRRRLSSSTPPRVPHSDEDQLA